jgi:hypothetical protein
MGEVLVVMRVGGDKNAIGAFEVILGTGSWCPAAWATCPAKGVPWSAMLKLGRRASARDMR